MENTFLNDCPFCAEKSPIFSHLLEETEHFRVVADRHPLSEGHILVIPKAHFCCIGECPEIIFEEFEGLHRKISWFLTHSYGSAAAFERGRIHRTIFHSQVHYLPYPGSLEDVVPEGRTHTASLRSIHQLQAAFQEDSGYQFLGIGDDLWLVNPGLAFPKFFRTRFAKALGTPERADWQHMHDDHAVMEIAAREIELLSERWKESFPDVSPAIASSTPAEARS
jgi:diadenosine tetraphosphate (Ap4A) HIT family hydrolase